MKRRRRRLLIALALVTVAVIALVARPAAHVIRTALRDADEIAPLPAGVVDDASRLNETAVRAVWSIPVDDDDPQRQLAALLARARDEGLALSIAGARHSMGGHTMYPGGIVVNMRPWNHMALDADRDVLVVGAGATWAEIIPYLDARGRSVAVMQSNDSFTVGGSISVNCHGWQFGRPPIASTVRSFRLMQADGTVVRCSREEHAELFSLALGGYGLFGIILDVELDVVPNERYRIEQHLVPAGDALATFEREVAGRPDVELVYARMSVQPDRLLDEVIINVFSRDDGGPPPAITEPGLITLRRSVFRGSEDSDYGKALRWNAETRIQPALRGTIFSRNQLLNEGVEVFANRSAETTDILHEYFVPWDRATSFVAAMREHLRAHDVDLLNVTVRSVDVDHDTVLRYADRPMLSFVMLFVQERTEAGEARMRALTRDLIDDALAHGGRYYLPYRLHATREQFRAAYPQAEAFFAAKRRYDPGELFRNRFYETYGAAEDDE